MTAHKTYSCNFCNDKIEEYGTDPGATEKRQGIGITYTANHTMKADSLGQCNSHLCANCIRALRVAFRELFPQRSSL